MPQPWESDPVVQPQEPVAAANEPWANDPVVEPWADDPIAPQEKSWTARILEKVTKSMPVKPIPLRVLPNTAKSIGAQTTSMIAGTGQMVREGQARNIEELQGPNAPLTPEQVTALQFGLDVAARNYDPEAARESAARFGAIAAEARAGAQEAIPADAGRIERAVQQGLSSAAVSLPAIVALGPGAGAALLGLGSGGARYSELRAKGIPEAEAQQSAVMIGSLEGLTEGLAGGKLVKNLPSFWKRVTEFLAVEIPGENINTLAQIVDDYRLQLNEDITVSDVLSAMADTTLATLVGGGAQAGAAQIMQRTVEAANRKPETADETAPDAAIPDEAPEAFGTPEDQPWLRDPLAETETLALPAPVVAVDREGVAATEAQREAAARQETERKESLGLTPDVERAARARSLRETESALFDAPPAPVASEAAEPPRTSDRVDGLQVGESIPNQSSIDATFENYETLDGIRTISIDEFNADPKDLFYAANDQERTRELAAEIKANGRIDPLIVVQDAQGYYVLEGAHRLGALHLLGKKKLPALVVRDNTPGVELSETAARTRRGIEVEELSPDQLTPAQRQAFSGMRRQRAESAAEAELDTQLTGQAAQEGQQAARDSGMDTAVAAMFTGAMNAPAVEFINGLDGVPADMRKRVKRSKGRKLEGLYDPKTNRVFILTDSVTTPERAVWVAAHEIAGHRGLHGLFNTREGKAELDRALTRARQNRTVLELADELKRQRSALNETRATEEAIAELSAAVRTGDYAEIESRYGVKVPNAVRGGVKAAILRFLHRIRAALIRLTGRDTFTDADVRKLVDGAWRYVRAGETREASGTAQEQPVEASERRQTDTTAFRRWFGGSKVVDETGAPRVVYHGTTSDIAVFEDPRRLGGIFFSSDPVIAAKHAEAAAKKSGGSPVVYPVYVKIERPNRLNLARTKDDELGEAIEDYDGYISTGFGNGGMSDELAVFNPAQIKSAIGNRGTFHPTDPDIRASEATTATRPKAKPKGRDRGYAKAAQQAIDLWNDKIGWRYGVLGKLPAQGIYLQKRYLALGKVHEAQEIGRSVFKALSQATAADQIAVYDYMTTQGAKPDAIKDKLVLDAAVRAKSLIDQVGQRLVRAGLMPPESYAANQGEYLPRVYLKYLLGEKNLGYIGKGKGLDLGYLNARKDIPEEVRMVIMGQITDPAFLASFGLHRTLRDLALIDFLEAVAANRKWVPDHATVEYNGRTVSPYWLRTEARNLRERAEMYKPDIAAKARKIADEMDRKANEAIRGIDIDTKDFQQIPDTRRYGALRGMWVRKEIHDDIVGAQQFIPEGASWAERVLGQGGTLTKVTQWWKFSKVALNLPTQARNFVSNMQLLHLSGVPFHRVYSGEIVLRALNSIRTKDKYYRIATKYGLFATTFSSQELRRLQDSWIQLQKHKGGSIANVKAMGAQIVNFASDAYALMEAIGKIAKLRDAMEREGKGEAEAMIEAHEALFDYSLVPRWVQFTRNSPLGIPFLTFQYKVLPQLAKVAVKHPLRFAPYIALGALPAALIRSLYDVDDDDIEKLKNTFPEWMRESGHMMLLPWKDQHGKWQVVDLGYIVPWGMYADFAKSVSQGDVKQAAKDLGLLSGPVNSVIAALATNVDPFTGKEIVEKYAPPKERLLQMLNYMWSLSAPGLFTEYGGINRLKGAIEGDVDTRSMEPPMTAAQAAMRMFGINVYPVDPEASLARNFSFMRWELSELRRQMNERMKDPNLTDRGRDRVAEVYTKLIENHIERMEEYAQDVDIHPNLAREAQP